MHYYYISYLLSTESQRSLISIFESELIFSINFAYIDLQYEGSRGTNWPAVCWFPTEIFLLSSLSPLYKQRILSWRKCGRQDYLVMPG